MGELRELGNMGQEGEVGEMEGRGDMVKKRGGIKGGGKGEAGRGGRGDGR